MVNRAGGHSLQKKRAHHGKTRNGCITCKIRHVKCDEEKPACRKCLHTGRQCDGYATITTSNSCVRSNSEELHENSAIALLRSPGDMPRASNQENRSLDFFRSRTVPALAGHFDFDFWGHLLLQVGHSEPVLQHAMVAVSVMHERFHGLGNLPLVEVSKGTDEKYRFALQQYNKAITTLTVSMASGNRSTEVTLICCLLFICLEFLQHNVNSAIDHVHSGLNILRSLQCNGQNPISIIGNPQLASSISSLQRILIHTFTRLNTQSSLFGRSSPIISVHELDSVELEVATSEQLPITNVIEARNAMDDLMSVCLDFVHSTYSLKHEGSIAATIVTSQKGLLRRLHDWLVELDALVIQKEITPDDSEAIKLLRIHHRVSFIWLSTCLLPAETSYDQYIHDFEFMIATGESMAPSIFKSDTFSFEMGILPPIYFAAITCRHPTLRRRAVALLASGPKQEGMWHSSRVASVASRVIEIEEKGLLGLDAEDCLFVPECARIHDAAIYPTFLHNPLRSVVRFSTKPWGLDGEWHRWTEEVIWVGAELL